MNGGERSLVANIGAANNFTVSHLETETSQEIINRAKVVYIAGFFLTVSIDSILKIATSAVENNKIFTMNLSAPFLIDFFGDQMAAAMPFCDIVFGNESEAAAYGKAKGYGDNLETIGLKLAAQPKASGTRARMVVFTQGSDCTMVIQDGVVKKYDVEKLPKVCCYYYIYYYHYCISHLFEGFILYVNAVSNDIRVSFPCLSLLNRIFLLGASCGHQRCR